MVLIRSKDSIQDNINKMYIIDNEKFMETLNGIMSAPKGTLAYQMRDAWAELAVSMNSDKLYESAE